MSRTANTLSVLAGALAFAVIGGLSACSPAAEKTAEAPKVEAPKADAPAPAATPAPAAPTAELIDLDITGADGAKLKGDTVAGEKVFRQCAACHVVQAGVNRTGPSLHGIIGRKAGSVEGFRYSDANKNSGKTWTQQAMFDYLENPRAAIPNTTMAFAGLKKAEDRANVIAYLKKASQ
jgi:cytochrome c